MKGMLKALTVIALVLQAFKGPILMVTQIISLLLMFLKPISDVFVMILRPVLMILAKVLVKYLNWWNNLKEDISIESFGKAIADYFIGAGLNGPLDFLPGIGDMNDNWETFKDNMAKMNTDSETFGDESIFTKLKNFLENLFGLGDDEDGPKKSLGGKILDKMNSFIDNAFGVDDGTGEKGIIPFIQALIKKHLFPDPPTVGLGKGTTAADIISQNKNQTNPKGMPVPTVMSTVDEPHKRAGKKKNPVTGLYTDVDTDFLKPESIFNTEKKVVDEGTDKFKGFSKKITGVTKAFTDQKAKIIKVFTDLSDSAITNISGTDGSGDSVASSFDASLISINKNLVSTDSILANFIALNNTFTTEHIINRTINIKENKE